MSKPFRHATKPPPKDWPRVSVSVYYEDPRSAIDWLCRAFGFEVRLKVEGEGGRIEHSELDFGEGLVMVDGAGELYKNGRPHRDKAASPKMVGGAHTQGICIYVDDVEAHHAQAREAGAKIVTPPETHDYGEDYWTDRGYLAEDPEGHYWWFMQRLRDVSK